MKYETYTLDLMKRARPWLAVLVAYIVGTTALRISEKAGGLIIPIYSVISVAAVATLVLSWKKTLRVDEDSIGIDRLLWGFDVPYREISHLYFFDTGTPFRPRAIDAAEDSRAGTYSIETISGDTFSFNLSSRIGGASAARSTEFAAALRYVEERTGLAWEGTTTSRENLASFLKRASGKTRRGEFLAWCFENLISVRPEIGGLRGPAVVRMFQIASLPLFFLVLLIVLVLTLEPGDFVTYLRDGRELARPPIWFASIFLLVAFATWALHCFSTNAVLAMARMQRREREALAAQMAAAREVQDRLLPSAPPSVPRMSMSGVCVPAQNVGGDYYDFVALGDRQLGVVVADVSGKGLAACLLMTMTKGSLATALKATGDLERTLAAVNEEVGLSAKRKMFVTLAAVLIDLESRVVRLARAGHNSPLLVTAAGASKWLEPSGIALGMISAKGFASVGDIPEVPVSDGDVLVLYSDGVTEAMNRTSDEYGAERLERVVLANRARLAEEIRDAIHADVEAFRDGAAASDDLTVVVIRFEA